MDPAAFHATYHNVKVIAGRKQLQIILEVPLEQADRVYQTLGWPNPHGDEKWVAVAMLNEDANIAPTPATPEE